MPNAFATNKLMPSANNLFFGVWWLTREMKKAGWRYIASSNGTTKDTTGNPFNDNWGPGVQVGAQTAAAASLTTVAGADQTVTGVTGMTTSSVGRYLKITGAASAANNGTWQIVSFLSATSVTIRNTAAVATDAHNGSITWSEIDPELDVYATSGNPLETVSAWWAARGPDVLKVPINAASVGTFLRGEKITQATSSAEGEIIGYIFDTVSTSYLTVLPRVGTFDSTHQITGATSGATVTPSAPVVTYVSEVVFWKNTDTNSGTLYYVRCTDSSGTENAQRFSQLTGTAGCTATVPPGGGGTANDPTTLFTPYYAMAVVGTLGSTNHRVWGGSQDSNIGTAKTQSVAVDCINRTGVSADGTFWFLSGMPGLNTTASTGFALHRMDDTEDGDLDPFLWYQGAVSTSSQAAQTTVSSSDGYSYASATWAANHLGWRRRGFSTSDSWNPFYFFSALYAPQAGGLCIIQNTGTVERVACHPASITVREPIWAISVNASQKHRKGTFRWLYAVPTGAAYDSWDSLTFMQVFTPTSSYPGLIIGPYDGVSTPASS
jgi:hypothetical protein